MAKTEDAFVEFLVGGDFRDLPAEAVGMIKKVVLNDLGAVVGGATSEGCPELLEMVTRWGGREEATVLVHGARVPAHNAALVNGAMMRALDIDDHMPPGLHIGGSALPAALAAAELAGGCSGRELVTALALGFEMTIRLNEQSHYDGFDPSGVCGIFAAVAAAGRILGLDRGKMLNALGLGFTRPIQTFQAIVDRTTAVRVGQGLIAQAAVMSAEMAGAGITGPGDFLEGVYGYFRFYGGGKYDLSKLLAGLGEVFHLDRVAFKNYPSCGMTIAGTDGILELIRKYDLTPDLVAEINVRVTPYTHKMTGKDFVIGNSPRVDAQFSIRYCIANALLRRASLLRHFDEDSIRDPRIMELVKKITVTPDPSLEGEMLGSSLRTDLEVVTVSGERYSVSVPIPSGFAGNPLSEARIVERFHEAASYGGRPLTPARADEVATAVQRLDELQDVRHLVDLLTGP